MKDHVQVKGERNQNVKAKRLHLLALVSLALGGLAGEELRLDEGDDTTLGDDNVAEELVQPESGWFMST